jgi:hypothetical protein
VGMGRAGGVATARGERGVRVRGDGPLAGHQGLEGGRTATGPAVVGWALSG